MNWYKDYKLVKDEDGGGYTLEIYLDKENTEFGEEFFSNVKENLLKLDERIRKLLNDKFSDFNINAVKIMVGTLLVATIPLAAIPKAQAAEPTPVAAEQTAVLSATTLNTTGVVTASNVNVRTGPSTGYPIIHSLFNGNTVKVIGESGDWYQIQLSDGRTGYVSKQYMKVESGQPSDTTLLNTTGIVTASRLNMRSGPSTSYSIIHVLWNGNVVKVTGQSGDWYKIQLSDGRQGFVSKQYLSINTGTTDTRQQKVDTVINTAKSFLGTPYVWGGESPAEGGFDCSGFTQYVYKQAGYSLNRISSDQATQGVAVSRANMQPGDLVFSSLNDDGRISHVGIYLGNGQMIHSPKTGDVVKISDINTSYWTSRFVTARRIII